MEKEKLERIIKMTGYMRKRIIEMSYIGNGSAHFGGGLSIVEIMAVLYGEILNIDKDNPEWEERDRFILSKGHGVLGYYTALAAAGLFEDKLLDTFQQNNSDLISHPVMNLSLGIESSNGSLGQGLSFAIGNLIAARKKGKNYKAYVLMGNGECNEGSVWEASMLAASCNLSNLIAIIDNNRLQSDGISKAVLDIGDLKSKWLSFGWKVEEVDGHSIPELYNALNSNNEKPLMIIANTVKGKGISFMENNSEWHHNRLNEEQYKMAILELKEQ